MSELGDVISQLGPKALDELNDLLAELQPKTELERTVLRAVATTLDSGGLDAAKSIVVSALSLIGGGDPADVQFGSMTPAAASDLLAAAQRAEASDIGSATRRLAVLGDLLGKVASSIIRGLL